MMTILQGIRVVDFFDILIVSIVVYYALIWFYNSRAFQLFKGFLVIVLLFIFSKILHLYTIEWLMQELATIIMILLIIVFQPELRRALERLGRQSFINNFLFGKKGQNIGYLNELIRSIESMSEKKTGALIVIEKATGLAEYLEGGLPLDAVVSEDLLIAIFQKNSPLHDGAVIIQGNRIAAVRCLLPLTENKLIDQRLGTRHRSAIGLTEVSDAIVLLVSEETGIISLAENGVLFRYLNKGDLEEKLLVDYI